MFSLFGTLGAWLLILLSTLYQRQFIPRPRSDRFDFENGTCFAVDAGYSSVYCLCNATFCDAVPSVDWESIGRNTVVSFTSSRDGLRFQRRLLPFVENNDNNDDQKDADLRIRVNASQKFQRILGFGGAFTDAAGINIRSLGNVTREKLLRSYFGKDGLSYTLGRVPMASSDFSTRCYSYAEKDNDFDLHSFSLLEEDRELKIPFIIRAQNLSEREIKLIASPWSPPDWMKSNGHCSGYGRIKGDPDSLGDEGRYYKSWAKYFVRFLEEYDRRNVSFWGITAQNEPTDGYIPFFSFNCLGFTATEQRDFIKRHLGPTLAASAFRPRLMILDDNRVRAESWVDVVLGDEEAARFVHGTAIHWYWNILSSASVTTRIHDRFPSKFILATEACDGWTPLEHDVWLGDWSRAQDYAVSIIEDLNNWVTGWTDWNLALDLNGGPNWAENFVDAAIIVNAEKDEFYRQPMFYVLGHFSKFIPPDSVVLGSEVLGASRVGAVAVETLVEGNKTAKVVVVHNPTEGDLSASASDVVSGRQFRFVSPAKSVVTLLWLNE